MVLAASRVLLTELPAKAAKTRIPSRSLVRTSAWIVSLLVLATPVIAQQPCGVARHRSSQPRYPAGTEQRLEAAKVDTLRCFLRQKPETWAAVRRYYFDSLYTKDFADIIVYIDPAGVVHQGFIHNNKPVRKRVLHGEKYVYVLIFSDSVLRLTPDTTRKTVTSPDSGSAPKRPPANAVIVTRTSLDYHADPFLSQLLKGLGQKLFGAVPERSGGGAQPDTAVRLEFRDVGDSAVHFYVTLGRFRLVGNTWNRITVTADTGRELRHYHSIVTNFANADASWFGLSVAVGVTFDARTQALKNDTIPVSVGQPRRVNPYLLGHLYFPFARPELPRQHLSASMVFGTNLLNGDLLNELVVGVSVDRLVGDMGLIGGVNFLPSKDKNRTDTRLGRAFVALDFHL